MKTKEENEKTKASHTPGPWTVEICPVTGDRFIVSDDRLVVCLRPTEADGKLMSAGPELLMAARNALTTMDLRITTRQKWTYRDQLTYEQLSAAIKKAEGE